MRLWSYRMISYLPNKHLVSQFRECCGIMSMMKAGKPVNNCIVSRVEEYDIEQFQKYCIMVCQEMKNRNFKMAPASLERLGVTQEDFDKDLSKEQLFKGWHDRRYEIQCLYMFQEKYDVNMITLEEYQKILKFATDVGIDIDLK